MSTIDYLIARGKTFTGRKLRDALHAATGNIVGGRGIRVSTINGQSVVSITGHTPRAVRSRVLHFTALLISEAELAPHRWTYEWKEAMLTDLDEWEELPDGRTSVGNPDVQHALNRMETRNTDQVIAGGVVIVDLPGSIEVLPATAGNEFELLQDVEMTEVKKPDGTNGYWFTFANGVQPSCPESSGNLQPPVELLA